MKKGLLLLLLSFLLLGCTQKIDMSSETNELPNYEKYKIIETGIFGKLNYRIAITVVENGQLKTYYAENAKIDETIDELIGNIAVVDKHKNTIVEIKKP